ncbi:MAG: hypothetical protein HYW24_02000 [Candidatus Aenigmarchaeota archaeon]|nr:hypothetical protein [Candidatus Aenigmarchaeota archaeon]
MLERLKNGLYIVEFGLPDDDIEQVAQFLKGDPSCIRLDTIVSPFQKLLIFSWGSSTSQKASGVYSHISEKVTMHRIPHPEYGDSLDGKLKTIDDYTGLGGSLNWIRVKCPKAAIQNVRNSIQSDRRIGQTYATDTNRLYSKVRIPEPAASYELQKFYALITGDNDFKYLPVIREWK